MTATSTLAQVRHQWPRRLLEWARRVRLERKLVIALLIAAVTSGVLTFLAFTEKLPFPVERRTLLVLLLFDIAFLLSLSILVIRRFVVIWLERRRGLAGARLHARMVGLFGLVAVLPALVLAVFSVVLFDFGLRAWFSDQVSTAIKNSLAVAEAYLEEHAQTITGDVTAMAQDINRGGPALLYNPQRLNAFITRQAAIRALTEAAVIDGSGNVMAETRFVVSSSLENSIPEWAKEKADNGEVVIFSSEEEGRVRAIYKLDSFSDTYLVVGRLIDARVLGHLDRTRGAYQLYSELEGERADLQITFAVLFLLVAILLLMASVWVGLAFANRLSAPIRHLIGAAEEVRAGNLDTRVEESESGDELDSLSRAFNRMTGQLEAQRHDLIVANEEMAERRRFIEAVLAGVSAGVVGLDREGRITIANRIASEILDHPEHELSGHHIASFMPELEDLLVHARKRPRRIQETEVARHSEHSGKRDLLVRLTAEMKEGGILGYVVTFDDITELVSAQRKAAWADVARRIAHEIKNPLTPIQLSAERLKRRYLSQVTEDRETFELCTDTIIRQVADIGRMVNEFSNFARMPAPQMERQDIKAILEEALFLQESAHPDISYQRALPEDSVPATCDAQQLSRAVTNVLQNAADSIAGRSEAQAQEPGRIEIKLEAGDDQVTIEIADNGKGLPEEARDRLTEPYVTHRERGTGLGLAIVKKIMEDHGGFISLDDRPGGGAIVRLVLLRKMGPGGARSEGAETQTQGNAKDDE